MITCLRESPPVCAISFYQSWEAAHSLNLLCCNHCCAIQQFGVWSAQPRFLNGVLWLYASLESVQSDKSKEGTLSQVAMSETEDGKDDGKPLDSSLGELLATMATTIANASHISVVIASLNALASMLYAVPEDLFSVAGEDCDIHSQVAAVEKLAAVCKRKALDADQRADVYITLRHSLYGSRFFSTLATLLLHQVAPDWLACFPSSALRWLFDEFFKQAPASEVILILAPSIALDHRTDEDLDGGLDSGSAVSAQAKRLLNLCLVQQHGVKEMALSFGCSNLSEAKLSEGGAGNVSRGSLLKDVFQVAQLVVSIPDRAGLKAPIALESPAFYQSMSRQLYLAAEERWEKIGKSYATVEECASDGTFVFIGEVIGRLCRRGHADVISSVYVPLLMQHEAQALSNIGAEKEFKLEAIKSSLQKTFWPAIALSIKDSHAMEKWVEAVLKEMATKKVSDWQAYCILWMIFGSLLPKHTLTRMVFLEKCLFVKILPFCCLKWVLQFAVLHSPPTPKVDLQRSAVNEGFSRETDVVRQLGQAWSSNDFIRSASLPKQAYLTAAVGICVRTMNKGEMEKCGNLMHSILQGVTNRLESPLPLVREMAKRVALAFSLVINPAKPLVLDEEVEIGSLDDWESLQYKASGISKEVEQTHGVNNSESAIHLIQGGEEMSKVIGFGLDAEKEERRRQRRERHEQKCLEDDDPDAIINLGEESGEWLGDGEKSAGDLSSDNDSDTDSMGSLQPYDMSDDDSELEKRKLPSQLRDCTTTLLKPDDPDAVERALKVAEELIRAAPVELDNAAEELARALVHVRVSSIAVEDEEDALEKRRHGAIVALLVCAPLSSVVIITTEIFSAHVDISQRLLLLDAMSDAAQELAGKAVASHRLPQQGGLITELPGGSSSQGAPWYGPGNYQAPAGSTPWSEVPALMPGGGSMLGWAHRYERVLPLRKGDRRPGKSRTWAPRAMALREQRQSFPGQQNPGSHNILAGKGENLFAPVAAAFMLPIMRDYDKRSHGVDFLDSGFIVLGKILYTLGVCMECITAQPEAPVLGAGLLELLRSRAVANHPEAYVRRAALYAASRVIVSLHPSQVVSAVTATDSSLATGLEWIREWALGIADNDPDGDCSTLAMACVQLHSEMALQAARALQTLPSTNESPLTLHSNSRSPIILPF